MRRAWIPLFLVSIAGGCALAAALPLSWGFTPPSGLFAGTALYFVAFQRYVVRERPRPTAAPLRWVGADGVLLPVLARGALFAGITVALLWVVYDLLRGVDLRWPLVTLAAWSVVDSLLGETVRSGERPGGR